VKKGDELFHLDATPIAAKVMAAKATAQRVEAELADLKSGTRKERIVASQAAVGEIDARIEEATHDLERYRRLVEEDKTVPVKKLEEIEVQLRTLKALREAAVAKLEEAKAGATATEIAVAEAKLEEARAEEQVLQVDLDDCMTRAPFDGIVVERYRSVGDYVNSAPFVEVLKLVSDKDLEAEIMFPEQAFEDVIAGKTSATVVNPGRPGSIEAVVTRRVDVIDPTTGQFTVRIAIPDDAGATFKPGAFVRATLKNARQEDEPGVEFVVPAAAVFGDAAAPFVFVAKDGLMHKTTVRVRNRLSDSVVVSSDARGLGGDDRVVVGPFEMLGDGKPLPKAPGKPGAN
jgi:RND family efflux transporter MFP subunit